MKPTLRDLPNSPVDQPSNPLAQYIESLPESRGFFDGPGLDPANPKDAPMLEQLINATVQGTLNESHVKKIMARNERAAPMFANALTTQKAYKEKSGKIQGVLSENFQNEGNVITGGEDDQLVRFRPGKRDFQSAITQLTGMGETERADKLADLWKKTAEATGKPDSAFAKINPKDYTPESIKRFQQAGGTDFSLLTHLDPDKESRTNEKAADLEGKLRGEFRGLAKPFIDVRDAYSRIQESAKSPSPAGDIALIYNFMKMLDPGSTVREGEYATAQNAGNIPSRVMAQYNKLVEGKGQLDADIRQDFVSRSRGLFRRQEASHKKNEAQYRSLSKRYGVNADRVVTDFNTDAEDVPTSAPSAEVSKVVNGKTYVKINGEWFEK